MTFLFTINTFRGSREDPPIALGLVSKQVWCLQSRLSLLVFIPTQKLEGVLTGRQLLKLLALKGHKFSKEKLQFSKAQFLTIAEY